jgi:hypothetical protein
LRFNAALGNEARGRAWVGYHAPARRVDGAAEAARQIERAVRVEQAVQGSYGLLACSTCCGAGPEADRAPASPARTIQAEGPLATASSRIVIMVARSVRNLGIFIFVPNLLLLTVVLCRSTG